MFKFAAILVLLGLAGAIDRGAAAQESYVFASPNTRSSLTDQDARGSLTSFEELNAIAIADRIACSMTSKVNISGALGVYDATAENSFLIVSDLKQTETEYLGSLLARYEHQRFVLLFFPQAAGRDRLWTIKTSKSFDNAIATVRRMHLTPVTLLPGKTQTEIWVVDIGDKFAQQPSQLAAELSGTATSQDGSAELLGDDDRAKSAAIFDGKIGAFERKQKRKLSSGLWSEPWRDASARTCSAEVPK